MGRFQNPHKTAIARRSMSAPARHLRDLGLVRGRVLDFGCGRGKDADELRVDRYDPHYAPDYPRGKYDTILCTYVLNTVSLHQQRKILDQLRGLLHPNGKAYLTVRRDVGETDSQRIVRMRLPVVEETSSYCIYVLAGS